MDTQVARRTFSFFNVGNVKSGPPCVGLGPAEGAGAARRKPLAALRRLNQKASAAFLMLRFPSNTHRIAAGASDPTLRLGCRPTSADLRG